MRPMGPLVRQLSPAASAEFDVLYQLLHGWDVHAHATATHQCGLKALRQVSAGEAESRRIMKQIGEG